MSATIVDFKHFIYRANGDVVACSSEEYLDFISDPRNMEIAVTPVGSYKVCTYFYGRCVVQGFSSPFWTTVIRTEDGRERWLQENAETNRYYALVQHANACQYAQLHVDLNEPVGVSRWNEYRFPKLCNNDDDT